jgi:hypothetical protein
MLVLVHHELSGIQQMFILHITFPSRDSFALSGLGDTAPGDIDTLPRTAAPPWDKQAIERWMEFWACQATIVEEMGAFVGQIMQQTEELEKEQEKA